LYSAVVYTVLEWPETGLKYKCTDVQLVQVKCLIHKPQLKYKWAKQSVCTCYSKSKVYTVPIWDKNGLWPSRCPQRNLEFFLLLLLPSESKVNCAESWKYSKNFRKNVSVKKNISLGQRVMQSILGKVKSSVLNLVMVLV
jgi:hypothetical protein